MQSDLKVWVKREAMVQQGRAGQACSRAVLGQIQTSPLVVTEDCNQRVIQIVKKPTRETCKWKCLGHIFAYWLASTFTKYLHTNIYFKWEPSFHMDTYLFRFFWEISICQVGLTQIFFVLERCCHIRPFIYLYEMKYFTRTSVAMFYFTHWTDKSIFPSHDFNLSQFIHGGWLKGQEQSQPNILLSI